MPGHRQLWHACSLSPSLVLEGARLPTHLYTHQSPSLRAAALIGLTWTPSNGWLPLYICLFLNGVPCVRINCYVFLSRCCSCSVSCPSVIKPSLPVPASHLLRRLFQNTDAISRSIREFFRVLFCWWRRTRGPKLAHQSVMPWLAREVSLPWLAQQVPIPRHASAGPWGFYAAAGSSSCHASSGSLISCVDPFKLLCCALKSKVMMLCGSYESELRMQVISGLLIPLILL